MGRRLNGSTSPTVPPGSSSSSLLEFVLKLAAGCRYCEIASFNPKHLAWLLALRIQKASGLCCQCARPSKAPKSDVSNAAAHGTDGESESLQVPRPPLGSDPGVGPFGNAGGGKSTDDKPKASSSGSGTQFVASKHAAVPATAVNVSLPSRRVRLLVLKHSLLTIKHMNTV